MSFSHGTGKVMYSGGPLYSSEILSFAQKKGFFIGTSVTFNHDGPGPWHLCVSEVTAGQMKEPSPNMDRMAGLQIPHIKSGIHERGRKAKQNFEMLSWWQRRRLRETLSW